MTVSAQSILAITSELPWPLTSGGRIRSFYLLRELAKAFPVRLVAGVSDGDAGAAAALTSCGIEVTGVPFPARSPVAETRRLLAASLRAEPYVLYRRHDRPEVHSAIAAEIRRESPALLYLDHLDSFVFRPLAPDLPCVVDFHNVYSSLTHRTALESGLSERMFLLVQARLLARAEGRAARDAAAVLTVSEAERAHFAALTTRPVHLVPNGVDCERFEHLPVGKRIGDPLVLFVGTLSWPPNVSAAEHLAREVLPALRRNLPDCRLRIVGRAPHERIRRLADCPGVEVAGEVEDVRPHFEQAHLLAVPLDAGGGTRLKILEAFAAGLPVVSTAIGCEGLDVRDGEHLLVSERPGFAKAIERLLADPGLAETLAANARDLSHRRYDWKSIGARMVKVVGAILERR